MDVAALVKQKKVSGYIKNRLSTGHSARQWIKVWDRLGYEKNEAGTILLVLNTTRLCIPRGTDKEGFVDASLRKKVTEFFHIPHLGEVKTGRADTIGHL